MEDFNLSVNSFEPENLLSELDIKTKLNVNFPKNEDNIIAIKNIILELYNKVNELEKRISVLEK